MTRHEEIQEKLSTVPVELIDMANQFAVTTLPRLYLRADSRGVDPKDRVVGLDLITLWTIIQFIIAVIKFFNNLGIQNYNQMGVLQTIRFNWLVSRKASKIKADFETKKENVLRLVDKNNLYKEIKYNSFEEV